MERFGKVGHGIAGMDWLVLVWLGGARRGLEMQVSPGEAWKGVVRDGDAGMASSVWAGCVDAGEAW